jgi:hypothetical protein
MLIMSTNEPETLTDFLLRGFVYIIAGLVFAVGSEARAEDCWTIVAASLVLWLLAEAGRHFHGKNPNAKRGRPDQDW